MANKKKGCHCQSDLRGKWLQAECSIPCSVSCFSLKPYNAAWNSRECGAMAQLCSWLELCASEEWCKGTQTSTGRPWMSSSCHSSCIDPPLLLLQTVQTRPSAAKCIKQAVQRALKVHQLARPRPSASVQEGGG